MLITLVSCPELTSNYDVCFCYRYSYAYRLQLESRLISRSSLKRLYLVDPNDLLCSLDAEKIMWIRIFRLLLFSLVYPVALLFDFFYISFVFLALRPDVVHINNGGYPGALSPRVAAIVAKIMNIRRVIMVVNNLAVPYESILRKLEFPLDQMVAASVDLFVTGSCYASVELQRVLRLKKSRITNIPNGYRPIKTEASVASMTKFLKISSSTILFGFAGLFVERKGIHVLLSAISLLEQRLFFRDHPCHFCIKGHGPLASSLKQVTTDLRISSYVTFFPFDNHVADFINSMNVMIVPSIANEDFPNITVESMSLAKPVIGSRVAGIPEQIVHKETGILVDPSNCQQLADAIGLLASNALMRVSMANAAQQRFEKLYSLDVVINDYLNIYS